MLRLAALLAISVVSQSGPGPDALPCDAIGAVRTVMPQSLKILTEAYRDCVRAEAGRLEPSGEAADVVASAAIAGCEAELLDHTKYVRRCGSSKLADDAATDYRTSFRQQAILRVVEIRATKRAK